MSTSKLGARVGRVYPNPLYPVLNTLGMNAQKRRQTIKDVQAAYQTALSVVKNHYKEPVITDPLVDEQQDDIVNTEYVGNGKEEVETQFNDEL